VIGQQTAPDLASRIPDIDWWAIAPELSLFAAALAVILLRSTASPSSSAPL
jgi:hypothetical protein